jgi:hypothetical protein
VAEPVLSCFSTLESLISDLSLLITTATPDCSSAGAALCFFVLRYPKVQELLTEQQSHHVVPYAC